MKTILKSILLLALGACTTSISAQDADEIINDYLKARGGKEKLMSIQSLRMTGESISQMGAAPMEYTMAAPNKNHMSIATPGGKILMAFDGESGWSQNPWANSGKATKADEETAKRLPQQPLEDAFINYSDKGSTVKYLGEEDVDDELHHKIRLTDKEGVEMVFYFNDDTKLISQMKMLLKEGRAKGTVMVQQMMDYKEVDGIMFNFKSVRKMGENEQTTIFSKIEVNPEITADLFSFPDEE